MSRHLLLCTFDDSLGHISHRHLIGGGPDQLCDLDLNLFIKRQFPPVDSGTLGYCFVGIEYFEGNAELSLQAFHALWHFCRATNKQDLIEMRVASYLCLRHS